MLLYPALADQLRQGPLYGRAGEAQVFGHSADSVPALAVLVCPVVEVDQHLLGPVSYTHLTLPTNSLV